jgi:bifunctional DNase/RNase
MQEMRVVHIYSCPRYGQVVLEDPHGMVKLHIRMRPMMAHWLAHELRACQCPAISMYRLLQELLGKLGGALRLAVIDASEENTPLGLLIIRQGGEEIHQSCHPADAVALSAGRMSPSTPPPGPSKWAAGRASNHGSRPSPHGTFPWGNEVVLSSGSWR